MTSGPALLITRDDLLLDDLLRLAAAAGVSLDVAHDASSGLRGWTAASVVLLGADLASRVAEQQPPRRDSVHVVGHGPVDGEVFRSALGAGALDVIELPSAEAWLVELLSDAVDAAEGTPGRAHTVGVVAGSGGAGATTFACALGLTAAADRRAMLVDLDPLGPGVDRVVGLDPGHGVRWDALVSSQGRLGSRSLRAALPAKDGLAVLTWEVGSPADLDAASVREVLSAAQRGNDLVVADLPRTVDDVTAEMLARCDRVLLVVEPSVAGVAAAGKVASAFRPLNERLGLVVRDGPSAADPGQVADVLRLPIVVEVARQRRLAEHLDLGLGPVHRRRSALARAARAALSAPDLLGSRG
jgi:secretion/DNA translocation related CpaE-like protein